MKKEEVYNPSHPDGQNNTIKEPISYDGIGKIGNRYLIPARQGRAVRLKKGKKITYLIAFWVIYQNTLALLKAYCPPLSCWN